MPRPHSPALLVFVLILMAVPASAAPDLSPAGVHAALLPPVYDAVFAPDAEHDPALPTPDELLGFTLGERPASGEALRAAFDAIAAASDRVRVFPYGQSHEGRELFYALVGRADLIADLEGVRAEHRQLALASPGEAREGGGTADDAPAVVWLGAGVHGGEGSGCDAALALLHHLAADRSEATRALLEDVLVLVDPLQNPDGRARFLADRIRWQGRVLSTDRQALAHQGGWPSARGNHYFLDLNRDWFALSQPESRARVRVLLDWLPEVTFDLHEMGSFDTYLFSPPREPFNPHLPATTHRWWGVFADAMASAFGEQGWSCYTGDWNEEFNPNRGASWPLFTGAVALLGEQASSHGAAVKRPDGSVLRYREAVHHQFTAALALLRSVAGNREDLHADFRRVRRDALAGRRGELRCYLIDAETRPDTARRLAETLAAQGIALRAAPEPFRLDAARSYWGERRGRREFAAGTWIVDLSHGEGRLARAILDFDPAMGDEFLARERRRLEAGLSSQLYESPAWSLAMAYGCEVYAATELPAVPAAPSADASAAPPADEPADASYGWLLDSADPAAVPALSALLAAGVPCRAGREAFVSGGRDYGPGSVVVRRKGGPPGLLAELRAIAAASGASFRPANHALSDIGPDLGSRQFRLLETPRVALLGGAPFYQTTFGAVWHYLDRELTLGCSLLRLSQLARVDLARYNVIIVPDASPGRGVELAAILGDGGRERLRSWILAGGTLLTLGEGSWILFGCEEPLAALRPRRAMLGELEAFEQEVERERGWGTLSVDELALRAGKAGAIRSETAEAVPGEGGEPAVRDEWQRRFSPQGAILRADLDPSHWLSAGAGERVPVLVKTDLALMSRQPAETIGRFAGPERIRLSGLLWPEARERWARTSYLSRETIGDGQVVAFLGNPVYRAYFHGTARLLANAILLGPGMGTSARVGW